jgi:hypothetical protein
MGERWERQEEAAERVINIKRIEEFYMVEVERRGEQRQVEGGRRREW